MFEAIRIVHDRIPCFNFDIVAERENVEVDTLFYWPVLFCVCVFFILFVALAFDTAWMKRAWWS